MNNTPVAPICSTCHVRLIAVTCIRGQVCQCPAGTCSVCFIQKTLEPKDGLKKLRVIDDCSREAALNLYTNLSSVFPYRVLPLVASFGFAVLLFSLGYVALEILFTNERRLLSIETELETPQQIRSSILPRVPPEPPYTHSHVALN